MSEAVALGALPAAGAIPAPHLEYGQLAPILIVFGAALAGIVIEAFAPRRSRHYAQLATAVAGLAAAFTAVLVLAAGGYAGGKSHIAAMGAVAVDGPALFLQGTILLVALLASFTFAERRLDTAAYGRPSGAFAAQGSAVPGSEQERTAVRAGLATTEVFPLLMFAVGGMLVFPAAGDLLTLFVSLEVFSLPLYLLAALARRRRMLSQEAALKYFLLGSFSSAILLFGTALLYGYAGTVSYGGIAQVVDGTARTAAAAAAAGAGSDALLRIGAVLVMVGLLFKVGAVPFHTWTPDVYQGAPTPVTGFMAAATKVAAFGALLRLLHVVLPGIHWDWRPALWGVAVLTMVAGAVIAVTQTDIKRLLAYSSIAHAGLILSAAVAADPSAVPATLFYLAGYSFGTLGAFAVVTLVRDADGEATNLAAWAGLARRSPRVAVVFTVFLLSFAGVPLTSGFAAKFAVFSAAARSGAMPLVLTGVAASAVAAFVYLKVIVQMFFREPQPGGPSVAVPGVLTSAAIGVGLAATLAMGVAPQYFLDLAGQAGVFAR